MPFTSHNLYVFYSEVPTVLKSTQYVHFPAVGKWPGPKSTEIPRKIPNYATKF